MAREIGAGISPGSIAFLSPDIAARQLGRFLCTGSPGIMSSVRLMASPPPWRLAPAYAAKITALLDLALADIAKHQTRYKERETVRTLNLYGDCLMKLGRKAQAIAKWQNVLDRFPTCSDFGRIEKKVKAVLGIR